MLEDEYCATPCAHGRMCTRTRHHEGWHSAAGYCTWKEGKGMPCEFAERVSSWKKDRTGVDWEDRQIWVCPTCRGTGLRAP